VLAFKDKLLAEGTSAANVKVKLTRLRTLLNYAVANDCIAENPAKGVTVLVRMREEQAQAVRPRRTHRDLQQSSLQPDLRPTQGRGEAAYWLPLLALYTGPALRS
jgi:site-specific recombinase XerC